MPENPVRENLAGEESSMNGKCGNDYSSGRETGTRDNEENSLGRAIPVLG